MLEALDQQVHLILSAKDQEVEILVGYEIDRDTTPLGGIPAVRAVSDEIQIFYENNFGYPIVSVEDEQTVVSNFKLNKTTQTLSTQVQK